LFHPNFVGKIPFFSDGESNANLGYLQQLIFVAALVYIVTYPGWWFQPTPLKNTFDSWELGLYYSQLNGKSKNMFQTTNQPLIPLNQNISH
jgi:hypothetical protein